MGAGFVEVTQESVSVLTDMAVAEHEIDEAAAEAAIRRAEEAMKSKHLDEEGYAAVQAALQKSSAQLRVKRRRQFSLLASLDSKRSTTPKRRICRRTFPSSLAVIFVTDPASRPGADLSRLPPLPCG